MKWESGALWFWASARRSAATDSVYTNLNVLDSTWAFKCERYPNGSIKKLKVRFCCRGDWHVYGI